MPLPKVKVRKKPANKRCDKGFPCKTTCISRVKNCKAPLRWQAKTFVLWEKLQQERLALTNKKRERVGLTPARLNDSKYITAERTKLPQSKVKPVAIPTESKAAIATEGNGGILSSEEIGSMIRYAGQSEKLRGILGDYDNLENFKQRLKGMKSSDKDWQDISTGVKIGEAIQKYNQLPIGAEKAKLKESIDQSFRDIDSLVDQKRANDVAAQQQKIQRKRSTKRDVSNMKKWEMTRQEYIDLQKANGSKYARLDGQMHMNSVAEALGEGQPVPNYVKSRYPNIESHPLYQSAYEKRTGEKVVPKSQGKSKGLSKTMAEFGDKVFSDSPDSFRTIISNEIKKSLEEIADSTSKVKPVASPLSENKSAIAEPIATNPVNEPSIGELFNNQDWDGLIQKGGFGGKILQPYEAMRLLTNTDIPQSKYKSVLSSASKLSKERGLIGGTAMFIDDIYNASQQFKKNGVANREKAKAVKQSIKDAVEAQRSQGYDNLNESQQKIIAIKALLDGQVSKRKEHLALIKAYKSAGENVKATIEQRKLDYTNKKIRQLKKDIDNITPSSVSSNQSAIVSPVVESKPIASSQPTKLAPEPKIKTKSDSAIAPGKTENDIQTAIASSQPENPYKNMKSVGEFHVKGESFASTRPKWESVIKDLQKKNEGDALFVSRNGQGFYVYKSGGQYAITTIKDKKAIKKDFVSAKDFEQNYRWYV